MRTRFKILTIILLLVNVSCKKEKNADRTCWQIIDFAGAKLNKVCDKTESELIDCVDNGSCGTFNVPNPITNCFYYKIEGNEFCWKINGNYFASNMTEEEAKLYAICFYNNGILTKIDCNSCELWYNREKRLYKPTGFITYTMVSGQHYCDDTLATIYQGRQIVRKDDVDSLITIQFSNDSVHW